MLKSTCQHLLKLLQLGKTRVCKNSARYLCTMPSDTSPPPAKKPKQTVEASSIAVDFLDNIKSCRLQKGAANIKEFKFNKKRARVVTECEEFPDECAGIVYWMSRDQRVQDNWAMLYAQKLAIKLKVPLHVCFCLVPKFLEATQRHFHFMLGGLREVETECRALDISFHLLVGEAKNVLPDFVARENIGGIVTDFCPLRVPRQWLEDLKEKLPDTIPVCQVDAHNIVPCWEASPKLEYGARTIRNKINNQLPTYLTEFPPVIRHPHKAKVKPEPVDWTAADQSLEIERSVKEVKWATPGTTAGLRMLEEFINRRLKVFSSLRNDPTKEAASNMSPWYHFGQVGVQRAMIMVKKQRSKFSESVNAYMEEGIVRRELADNFCYYNDNYDKLEGAYDWAKTTLELHKKDKREKVYTQEQLDRAKTHDDLWNAAQKQLVVEGKMHGFLRMYWAKKILEWTPSPEEALRIAIHLNDRYSLDGRDPNGYVGCMWSICGIHDQGWAERAVFGKIRYMNYAGCKRKFAVADFERKYKKTQL